MAKSTPTPFSVFQQAANYCRANNGHHTHLFDPHQSNVLLDTMRLTRACEIVRSNNGQNNTRRK